MPKFAVLGAANLGLQSRHPAHLVDESQRPRDRLQRPALGAHREQRRDHARADHQRRAEQIAAEQAHARAGVDQRAEQPGPRDAADTGTDRVEDRDGERVSTRYAEGYYSMMVEWIRSGTVTGSYGRAIVNRAG